VGVWVLRQIRLVTFTEASNRFIEGGCGKAE
jgi:hypothetical protein